MFIKAHVLPKFLSSLPCSCITSLTWPHSQNLQSVDPYFSTPSPINLSIEADFYGQIIKPEILKDPTPSPISQLTIFG